LEKEVRLAALKTGEVTLQSYKTDMTIIILEKEVRLAVLTALEKENGTLQTYRKDMRLCNLGE
jgi:hypothetical protein